MHVRLSLAYQLQVRRQRTGIDENFYCALAKTEKVPNEQKKMKEDVTWGPKRNECVISCMRAGYQKQTCNKERGQVREKVEGPRTARVYTRDPCHQRLRAGVSISFRISMRCPARTLHIHRISPPLNRYCPAFWQL